VNQAAPGTAAGLAERHMLEFLVCPVTRGPLVWDVERQELVSRGAGLAFPVQNGVPVMLVDEARQLDDYTPDRASS
jgi:uncharacterized protein YbaR (Trm112 family)